MSASRGIWPSHMKAKVRMAILTLGSNIAALGPHVIQGFDSRVLADVSAPGFCQGFSPPGSSLRVWPSVACEAYHSKTSFSYIYTVAIWPVQNPNRPLTSASYWVPIRVSKHAVTLGPANNGRKCKPPPLPCSLTECIHVSMYRTGTVLYGYTQIWPEMSHFDGPIPAVPVLLHRYSNTIK